MACGMRLYAWRKHVELLHSAVEAACVVACYLHRLHLFQPCFLGNLVLTLVCIMLQVAHIGDVPDVAHLISQVLQIAIQYVKRDGGACMTQVCITVNGGSADVHAHSARVDTLKCLLLASEGVVYK